MLMLHKLVTKILANPQDYSGDEVREARLQAAQSLENIATDYAALIEWMQKNGTLISILRNPWGHDAVLPEVYQRTCDMITLGEQSYGDMRVLAQTHGLNTCLHMGSDT